MLYHKKSKQSKLKSLKQGKKFFTFTLRFSTFRDSFKLGQRAFRGEVLQF